MRNFCLLTRRLYRDDWQIFRSINEKKKYGRRVSFDPIDKNEPENESDRSCH